ncbi:MAG TPA: L,D-transpeptidase [Chthoniobacterales bacterium]|jgi:lipoprotein-anchoring transpeptidase ErfK/SrfK
MHIHIDLARQRLTLLDEDQPVFACAISSSFVGPGTEPGSLRTPTGNFAIAEKYGHDAPIGTVFRSRQPTGELADPHSPDDQIVTRILWLDGTGPENANTHSRYIYLHGTNHEEHLGLPASHGCIRMANADIADLFPLVDTGTAVLIF